jgi:hypothetical protein
VAVKTQPRPPAHDDLPDFVPVRDFTGPQLSRGQLLWSMVMLGVLLVALLVGVAIRGASTPTWDGDWKDLIGPSASAEGTGDWKDLIGPSASAEGTGDWKDLIEPAATLPATGDWKDLLD